MIDSYREHSLHIIMQTSLLLLLHKQQRPAGSYIVNRHNIKLFIRILVGIVLAHIVGRRFRPSNAAPNSLTLNWNYQSQATVRPDGKFT